MSLDEVSEKCTHVMVIRVRKRLVSGALGNDALGIVRNMLLKLEKEKWRGKKKRRTRRKRISSF